MLLDEPQRGDDSYPEGPSSFDDGELAPPAGLTKVPQRPARLFGHLLEGPRLPGWNGGALALAVGLFGDDVTSDFQTSGEDTDQGDHVGTYLGPQYGVDPSRYVGNPPGDEGPYGGRPLDCPDSHGDTRPICRATHDVHGPERIQSGLPHGRLGGRPGLSVVHHVDGADLSGGMGARLPGRVEGGAEGGEQGESENEPHGKPPVLTYPLATLAAGRCAVSPEKASVSRGNASRLTGGASRRIFRP